MQKYVVAQRREKRSLYYEICGEEDTIIVKQVSKYLRYLKRVNRSPNTIKRIAYGICYYLNFLEYRGLLIQEVLLMTYYAQKEHFQDFLYWIKAGRHCEKINVGRNNNTCNSYLQSVFGFYGYAMSQFAYSGAILVLVPKGVSYVNKQGVRYQKQVFVFDGYFSKERARKEESLNERSIGIIVNACTNMRDIIMLLIMAETGFRIGEMLGIRHTKDIDYENQTITVTYRENNSNNARAKNAEERTAKISEDTFKALIEYITGNRELLLQTEYLFVNLHGKTKGEPLSVNAVYSVFRQLEKKTGIKATPHMLRHYFANARRKNGWDLVKICHALGHKSIETTKNYIRIENDEMMDIQTKYFASTQSLFSISKLFDGEE